MLSSSTKRSYVSSKLWTCLGAHLWNASLPPEKGENQMTNKSEYSCKHIYTVDDAIV